MYPDAVTGELCFEMQSTTIRTAGFEPEHVLEKDMFRVLYVVEGTCHYQCLSTTGSLQGDHMLLLRGPLRYQLWTDTHNASLTSIDLRIAHAPVGVMTVSQMETSYPTLRQYMKSNEKMLPFQDSASLILTMLRLLSGLAEIKTEDRRMISCNLIGVFLEGILLTHQENMHPVFGGNPHVRKALQFLHDKYAFQVSAEDAARFAGIHPVHLSRLFYAECGLHVREYLTRLRIERAKNQLARTRLPIQSIAMHCGFTTHPYFTRVFLHETGVTPQAYRQTYDITCDYGNYEKHIGREVSE